MIDDDNFITTLKVSDLKQIIKDTIKECLITPTVTTEPLKPLKGFWLNNEMELLQKGFNEFMALSDDEKEHFQSLGKLEE